MSRGRNALEDHEWKAMKDHDKLDWLRNALDRKLTIEMNEIMAIKAHLHKVDAQLEKLNLSLVGKSQ